MKYSLALGSILLLAPTIAQAQFQPIPAPESPSLSFPRALAQTPALDAFAQAGRQLQLQARWVRIDAVVLPTAFPTWNSAGTSSHVATPEELRALEVLRATGAASVTEQKINATNNQIAQLSFSPFVVIEQPRTLELPAPGPLDDMIIPRDKSNLNAQIEMPNLAKPQSKRPAMAPMPGADDRKDSPFATQNPSLMPHVLPQSSRGLANLLAHKFHLRPNFIGNEIALELRDSDRANSVPLKAMVKAGETVVFSIPDVLITQGRVNMHARGSRTFLLVTPTLPQVPREGRKLTR